MLSDGSAHVVGREWNGSRGESLLPLPRDLSSLGHGTKDAPTSSGILPTEQAGRHDGAVQEKLEESVASCFPAPGMPMALPSEPVLRVSRVVKTGSMG